MSTLKKYCFIVACFYCGFAFAQQTPFELSNGKQTATYAEAIQWYESFSKKSGKISMKEMGPTDAGLPLHVVLISEDGQFDPAVWHQQKKVVMLINNGIHPGEPDGIDASMMLARDIYTGKIHLPKNVALAIIPVYNIGGCLNRNAYTRVNQNGPEAYGFRGNSQNLDLNRDFIKTDSREARSFSEIFHFLEPDILVDTHVSDGADFQHTMTMISTQYNKLGTEQGQWMRTVFEPALYKDMQKKGWDMIPYVDFGHSHFNKGMQMFYDPPRYSSGYAALFGTFAFMPETHMLKPFAERVKSTYDLLASFIQTASSESVQLLNLRQQWMKNVLVQEKFPLSWIPDSTQFDFVHFKGYEQDTSISKATGFPRMYYNREKPFDKKLIYYHGYKPLKQITKPVAYVIPQGWHEVIERLRLNHVDMKKLQKDSIIEVESYVVEDYKSYNRPYEKHHKNHSVKVFKTIKQISLRQGDFIIYLNQKANRYIVEMLEPEGDDGFFAWNFFDAILQQKEGYSDYRWEDIAADLLNKDSILQNKLEKRKALDPSFASKPSAILEFIYKNSPYYENAFLAYPVYRIIR